MIANQANAYTLYMYARLNMYIFIYDSGTHYPQLYEPNHRRCSPIGGNAGIKRMQLSKNILEKYNWHQLIVVLWRHMTA